jgi:uncharacterized repeat protein (TIGR03803 family)
MQTRRFRLLVSAIFLLPTLFSGAAHSQTVTVLYNFTSQGSSQYPQDVALAQGRNVELYGTTTQGGIGGSIFKVSTSSMFTELFSFDGTDGCCTGEGMILAGDGNFYGVAPEGGNGQNGVLFKISSSGTYTAIYYFNGGADGANPFAPPVQASDGNLYGTTENFAGTGSTVYKYTPSSGNFSTIYQFSSGNIAAPLIEATDGFLYGATGNGGFVHCGTIFKMSTSGVQRQSYHFPCGAGGYGPSEGPLLQASDGNFYGTTELGGLRNGGTVFKMAPDFQVSILYTFLGKSAGSKDGSNPAAGLIQATDGNLYGATFGGGDNGMGTLFQISTSGAYKLLYSFDGVTGKVPAGTLMQHTNGAIYGTAQQGGANGLGTVYELNLGLGPFITFVRSIGKVGQKVGILGQGFTGATSVSFNGIAATSFTVDSPTYLSATVPSGATTGPVVVTTPTGTLTSNRNFSILP